VNTNEGRCDVIVVGAGISGLVAAWHLQQAGLSVQVIESGARAGGVIGTRRQDGCLVELGPNSALETSPVIAELIDALGLRDELRHAPTSAARRYVVKGGRPVALPGSPADFIATPLFSWRAKLALLREPFVKPSAPEADESIAAFVRRRLGQEFLDLAIDPFVAGIYAGDPEAISVRAAFPRLHALEQRWGSLLRGQFLGARERRRLNQPAKHLARSFSFTGGMQALTDRLAARIQRLALRTRAVAIQPDALGFTLQAEQDAQAVTWRSRALLLALPADAAATLLRPQAPDAATALDGIVYAPVATVATAYPVDRVAHALDGFGCLVPRREGRQMLGVLFSSTLYEGRAPAGTALLTAFIGGQRQPELVSRPEQAIGELALAEQASLLGARGAPLMQTVTRWPRAIPQYNLGHLARVQRVDTATQAWPGLFCCANWKGGVAVGDRILQARDEAAAVVEHLREKPAVRVRQAAAVAP
jgi:oxygen-dependent protoporphyrinogen oxidase